MTNNSKLDNIENSNIMKVSIWDLKFLEEKLVQIVEVIDKDLVIELLSSYYFFQVSSYLNTKDYESIEKLEGILDLINQIQQP